MTTETRPFEEFVADRFGSAVDVSGGPEACWPWQRALAANGYGRAWRDHRSRVSAHRRVYELTVGPVPVGMVLDHLCRVRHCVNPTHMEPVTLRENVLRGAGPSARAARATRCPSGHQYDATNTRIVGSTGERKCRTCNRLAARRRRIAATATA